MIYIVGDLFTDADGRPARRGHGVGHAHLRGGDHGWQGPRQRGHRPALPLHAGGESVHGGGRHGEGRVRGGEPGRRRHQERSEQGAHGARSLLRAERVRGQHRPEGAQVRGAAGEGHHPDLLGERRAGADAGARRQPLQPRPASRRAASSTGTSAIATTRWSPAGCTSITSKPATPEGWAGSRSSTSRNRLTTGAGPQGPPQPPGDRTS